MKGYGVIEDRSLWLRPKFGRLGEIRLNPVVYVLSLSIIIAFVVWAMIFPAEAKEEFGSWKVGIFAKIVTGLNSIGEFLPGLGRRQFHLALRWFSRCLVFLHDHCVCLLW